jgi:hypothetical protein
MTDFRRAPALLVSVLVIAATVWPAFRDPPRDSFPLSTYPMFSSVREQPWIDVIVGFTADDGQRRIGPELVANAEVMQAAQTVRQAIRRKRAKALCAHVAERVGEQPELVDVVRLEVQSRQFDPRTYFTQESGRTPLRTRRRARCEVPR